MNKYGITAAPMDELEPVIIMAKPVDPVERKGGMRLNLMMKQEIVEKAMKAAFEKREKDLLKEEQALAKACWMKNFGPAKLKHARALGEPFARENRDNYGAHQPDGVRISWAIGGHYVPLRTQMPIPTHPGQDKHWRINDEKLIERCRAWQSASEDLKKEKEKIYGTLTGMLQHITTYPSLEKNWPAGKKFYEHLPKKYPFRHQGPAVLIDELNAALGIG